eukprot:Mrub_13931.p1 GENE.Mrub_13931~~Mrub_13931.p1  ORF type:complete len:152 (-),score=10.07 Mrub_13931:25-423(-)
MDLRNKLEHLGRQQDSQNYIQFKPYKINVRQSSIVPRNKNIYSSRNNYPNLASMVNKSSNNPLEIRNSRLNHYENLERVNPSMSSPVKNLNSIRSMSNLKLPSIDKYQKWNNFEYNSSNVNKIKRGSSNDKI